ncbi:hypothetical protein T439DRAFT_327752 [Meredithblackwellia eburnea MCA 4105]
MPKARRQPQRAVTVQQVDPEWVKRRIKRHLADLERTNYTEPTSGPNTFGLGGDEDPENERSAPGASSAALEEQGKRKKKSTAAVRSLLLYRKTLATLIEESGINNPPLNQQPNYLNCVAPPSKYPRLQLCSVCGYKGKYACQRCLLKVCDMGCKAVHDETRCERR